MKRRQFLQTASTVFGWPLAIHGMGLSAMAKPLLFSDVNDDNDRVLVLVQLNGGNDGLNTIIPLDQYDKLYRARENVIIPESNILTGADNWGFHPGLTGIKQLYEESKLGIVQSVGYPNQNRSHFRSIDVWNTASRVDEYLRTGWLGRFLEQSHPEFPENYPNTDFPDPFAIAMGYQVADTCQGSVSNFSISLTDPFNLQQLPESDQPIDTNSLYYQELSYLTETIDQTNQYATRIGSAADSGNNLANYPDTELAQQLKHVARLIAGGLRTKIYTVTLGGFDTHAEQVEDGAPTRGTHADLLQTLSEAIAAFQQDLQQLGLEERVLGMTFSEFGRQIRSNGGFGTDHGTAAPLLLFGPCVKPRVLGHNPEIPDQVEPQEGVPMQYDFRDVYGSVLIDWFELEEATVKQIIYEDFQYLPLVTTCNTSVSTSTVPEPDLIVSSAPNPFQARTRISFTLEKANHVHLSIVNPLGQVIELLVNKVLPAGPHVVNWNGQAFPTGNYYYRLSVAGQSDVGLLIKH